MVRGQLIDRREHGNLQYLVNRLLVFVRNPADLLYVSAKQLCITAQSNNSVIKVLEMCRHVHMCNILLISYACSVQGARGIEACF